jgi:hypothetical protein
MFKELAKLKNDKSAILFSDNFGMLREGIFSNARYAAKNSHRSQIFATIKRAISNARYAFWDSNRS